MWLFVPLCKSEHWVLAIVDLSKIKIHLYNSLGYSNIRYYILHAITIKWLKYFLSWRFGEYIYIHFLRYLFRIVLHIES
jgi:Ulp1 protease family, C-terminal catalytic domain